MTNGVLFQMGWVWIHSTGEPDFMGFVLFQIANQEFLAAGKKQGEVTLQGFPTVRAWNKRNRLLGSCTILRKPNKVRHFPVKERTCWLSIRLFLPPRDPAVGV